MIWPLFRICGGAIIFELFKCVPNILLEHVDRDCLVTLLLDPVRRFRLVLSILGSPINPVLGDSKVLACWPEPASEPLMRLFIVSE